MHDPEPNHRRTERRLLPDRRRGFERRIGERRVRVLSVVVQRRQFASRRGWMERRTLVSRRVTPP